MSAHRRLGAALAGLAVVLAGGAGCKSAAPRAQPAAGPPRVNPLAGWVGQKLVLRRAGDVAKPTFKLSQLSSIKGECDVVAEVNQARFDGGTAVLTMRMVGRPRLARRGAREERCGDDQAQTVLTVSGFDPGASTADLEAALGPVLQTPDAYLRTRGVAFDIPAGKAPAEPTPDHFITTRPVRLLWFDPVRMDPARRVRHEGEVEVEGVVGADGRFYDARLLTALGSEDEQRLRELLPLWRFEPGRRGNDRVPVKVRERLVFRIFY